MIGAHVAGIQHTYKNLKKIPRKCPVCGGYSECQILKYEKSTHFFYIKIKVLEELYIFDWEKCNHRAVLYDKEDISRYKKDQEETGIFSVPYYKNMKLRTMPKPKKVSTIKIVLVVAFSLILGLVLAFLFDKLGIPFVF